MTEYPGGPLGTVDKRLVLLSRAERKTIQERALSPSSSGRLCCVGLGPAVEKSTRSPVALVDHTQWVGMWLSPVARPILNAESATGLSSPLPSTMRHHITSEDAAGTAWSYDTQPMLHATDPRDQSVQWVPCQTLSCCLADGQSPPRQHSALLRRCLDQQPERRPG